MRKQIVGAEEARKRKRVPRRPNKLKRCRNIELAQEGLAKFAPPLAHISLETVHSFRWRGEYPNEYPPRSFARPFDPYNDGSSRAAALDCLKWLWRCHEDAPGATCFCPWGWDTFKGTA